MAVKRAVLVVLVAALAGGCGGGTEGRQVDQAASATTATVATTAAPTTTASSTTTTVAPATTATPPPVNVPRRAAAGTTAAPRPPRPAATQPSTTAPPATSPPTTLAAVTEPFHSSVARIDEAIAARMTASWRPGCPVGLDGLRLLTVTHWGFDGQPRTGEVVIAARHADAMVGVFAALFRARFPIEQMRLVDEFGADDDRSMAANNTSAFNCRTVAGTTRWSEHAYGTAIDVNPVQNPYVTRSGVSPPAGAAHTSRDASTPGLITRDGPVVAAFAAIGWGWGGSWSSGKDYQHFSASGR